MGMNVSSIYRVPSSGYETYVFLINPGARLKAKVDGNFSDISAAIGKSNLFVHFNNPDANKELYQFLNQNCREEFILIEEFFNSMPSLLISKGAIHSTIEPIYILPIPFEKIDQSPNDAEYLYHFLETVINHIKDDSLPSILDTMPFETILMKNRSIFISTLTKINKYLELKPNIAGVGVNLNGIIDDIIAKHSG